MPMLSNAPILWSFRRCPFAIRARLAIAASGQIVQLREILLRDKPAAFLAASAKGTVPILDLRDGTVIEESREIMTWALGANDPDGWLDVSQQQPDKVKIFLDNVDGPFKHDLDRYKYANRYEVSAALSGSGLGFLDFAILPFIRQFRIADPKWFDSQPWPYLHRWLQEFLESAAFLRVMLKYPPWQEGAKAVRFPA